MPRNHVVHGTFGSVTKLRRLGGGGEGEREGACLFLFCVKIMGGVKVNL